VTSLVRSNQTDDSIDDLRARMAELERTLDARRTEIRRTTTALEAFRIRYRQDVGRLHEELDELEVAIAELELGEINTRIDGDGADPAAPPAGPTSEPAARFTSDAVRTLFRDVAKTIHPDLADDDDERERRHKLMIEANRAYAQGDEERLRWILQVWENSPEAVTGSDLDAMRLRLMRRIAQIEEQLTVLASELADLKKSSLWQLKAMVDAESANGNDLMADMIRRLNRDILVARNRLDALR